MSSKRRVLPAGPRLAAKLAAERLERRQVVLRRAAWTAAVLLPVLLLGWIVLGSSLLAVRQVTVSGQSRLTQVQVLRAAAVADGTPLAQLDTAAVARRVRRLPQVAQVTVSRTWPHGLRVAVVERRPVVAVPQGRRVLLLDGQGVALGHAPRLPAGVLRLDVPDAAGSGPATTAALHVLDGLPAGLASRLHALRASSAEQVTLVLRGGREVLWGGAEEGAAKAAAVTALLAMPGTVFDVSAPGVVTRR